MQQHFFRSSAILAAVLLATGCSVLEENKVDYRSSRPGESLEVPPDLTAISGETRYAINAGGVSASTYQNEAQARKKAETAANQIADARIERRGNTRWLVVDRPAKDVWPAVVAFWKDNGFTIATQQESLGIMETDWAENKAKVPQDFVRQTLGKVFANQYETSERDKFRTRLENNGKSTEIFISHKGMIEKLTSRGGSKDPDSSTWEGRPADPELEAEFLRRLMMKLGMTEDQAKAAFAQQTEQAPAAQFTGDVITMSEGFDSAWRKVGLALDRSNFTVADRDRSQGIYFVRYAQPSAKEESKGFLGKIFGSSSSPQQAPKEYRVRVVESAGKSQVTVQNPGGQADNSAEARSILKLVAEELK